MTTTSTTSGGPPDSAVAAAALNTEFASFCLAVEGLLTGTAASKSYNKTGTEGPNLLYEFVREINGNDAHALGEIVYKVKRFSAKGNMEDILKAAAWCFLVWKYRPVKPEGPAHDASYRKLPTAAEMRSEGLIV